MKSGENVMGAEMVFMVADDLAFPTASRALARTSLDDDPQLLLDILQGHPQRFFYFLQVYTSALILDRCLKPATEVRR